MIMNKERLALLLSITMIIFFLTGCGSKEEVPVDEPMPDTAMELNGEEQNEEADEQLLPEEPENFECLDEIKNASPDSGMVQIDDMIFQYGAKFSEILEVIEQSECTYTADEYDENRLVLHENDWEDVAFRKNDIPYFSFRLINPETETIQLKDCVVSIITAKQASKGNVYYAGFNGEEMTYDSIKKSIKNYEPDHEYSNYDSDMNKQIEVLYIIPSDAASKVSPNSQIYVYLLFESDTGDLRALLISGFVYKWLP
ncbi:MAG: hypothetical protein NC318_04985 [Blautia sp.]|nr:hypothetical protein [Lachnoclostridium sp.]MCM1210937.1 hypothetical protein [Blautia sp.]